MDVTHEKISVPRQPKDIKLVFFGNERLATGVSTTAPTLRKLIHAGYNVTAVVSHHTSSNSRAERELEIAAVAHEFDIPVLLPAKPVEIIGQLQAIRADIGILVAYGKIVPQSVIDIFPGGIINIHPSLLPLHRGPTPLESVILSGATETGVSVMKLALTMDAGPVYQQVLVMLDGTETKQYLADKLLSLGGDMIVKLLPSILDGSAVPESQNNAAASYDNLLTKQAGLLDFSKPAGRLEREIRAYQGWPKSHMTIGDIDVVITAAHAVPKNISSLKPGTAAVDGFTELAIQCSFGSLYIDRIKPAGKQDMPAAAFIAGYRQNIPLIL